MPFPSALKIKMNQALTKSSGTVMRHHSLREAQNSGTMCDRSQHIILTETINAEISWCKECKTYSLIYNSCCIACSKNDLLQLKEVLHNLTDADFYHDISGEKQVMLKNHFACMGICLTMKGAASLKRMIGEALTVNEVFQIIYN